MGRIYLKEDILKYQKRYMIPKAIPKKYRKTASLTKCARFRFDLFCVRFTWDYYTETRYFPAARIIELLDRGKSHVIVMQSGLYRHLNEAGRAVCGSRGKHGNCRCHSVATVKPLV